jgi:hypothetical protein
VSEQAYPEIAAAPIGWSGRAGYDDLIMKSGTSHTSALEEKGVMAAVVVRADAPWPAGRLVLPRFDGIDLEESMATDAQNDYVVIPATLLS